MSISNRRVEFHAKWPPKQLQKGFRLEIVARGSWPPGLLIQRYLRLPSAALSPKLQAVAAKRALSDMQVNRSAMDLCHHPLAFQCCTRGLEFLSVSPSQQRQYPALESQQKPTIQTNHSSTICALDLFPKIPTLAFYWRPSSFILDPRPSILDPQPSIHPTTSSLSHILRCLQRHHGPSTQDQQAPDLLLLWPPVYSQIRWSNAGVRVLQMQRHQPP